MTVVQQSFVVLYTRMLLGDLVEGKLVMDKEEKAVKVASMIQKKNQQKVISDRLIGDTRLSIY